jgi:hypothetical protein
VKFFIAVMLTQVRLHFMRTDTAYGDCENELSAAVHMTAMETYGKL